MLESKFQAKLIKEIEGLLPGCMILKLDPSYIQGIPDLIILWKTRWATLEAKRFEDSPHQPNQDFYIELMNGMSFSRMIYPGNKEEVLYALQQSFGP